MDRAALASTAREFEELLGRYATSSPEARSLLAQLQPIIEAAIAGRIRMPLDQAQIPGGRYFLEGELGEYRDLEDCYARLNIELTGGRTESVQKILAYIESVQRKDPK